MNKMNRCTDNPLITPADIKPSNEHLKVEGVFNCGVTKYNDEVMLLCRVAESVKDVPQNEVRIPVIKKREGKDVIDIVTIVKENHPEYDFSDNRTISRIDANGISKAIYLTSLSHLRIARSKDGIHFTVDEQPCLLPQADEEGWGMEDPRITKLMDTYYISYTAVSENGAKTALVSTRDFKTFKRHGIIFAPENKDVTIFPEMFDGMYLAFNRPVPYGIGYPDMWMAKSPDLIHWGGQKHFYGISEDGWENGRIGGGAVPFLTERGWIKIYHAADKQNRYCLGAFLLDTGEPSKILAKSAEPILEPEEWYEKEGFFPNVVFTCGCIFENGMVSIYYGAADDKICRADISLEDIYGSLQVF
ncbi:putative GH43/DUF377 family glycosyl hydrolase [Anaerotaenia torta]|uniref:glycoside hydrolase family 130 protein n=1 Tax=Anaerotaenia torta TaxID=433293 RepID=UPI003D201605